jgi:transcriptional regulator with XRE-family HTH domain
MGASVGERLREIRKRRGLTQRELAAESGVSLSLIRKLEQGERQDTRLETVRQLAVTLRVPTTRLIVAADEEAASAATVDQWAPVRHALLGPPQRPGDVDEAPTVAGVRATLDAALPLFSGDRLSELGTLLPALLRDADEAAYTGPEGRAV